MAPFTEDPTEERLTEYVEFITTSVSPTICEHKVKDGEMRMIGDKVDMICLNSEKKKKSEGPIYQKDLVTFFYHHLGKEKTEPEQKQKHKDTDPGDEDSNHVEEQSGHRTGDLVNPKKQWNRRGYWLIEVADRPEETSPPLPVFQFATFCLEVYPADMGVIKLGTEDVAHILRSCTETKGGMMIIPMGRKFMPKLSGLATSDNKKSRMHVLDVENPAGTDCSKSGWHVDVILDHVFETYRGGEICPDRRSERCGHRIDCCYIAEEEEDHL
ncbi:hypothetical protein DHEL01_v208332 [Diaporthe helianthi]|uniref:Uncharacterized protein n=1 Tax=Diaporthe helianthi TaxID=158607 RepID=A0A2P5HSP6_DIAHE|nr:hypothetical protein DHEL01_v208332 [Diaporthe helianthi]